jgi:hypothetical protein
MVSLSKELSVRELRSLVKGEVAKAVRDGRGRPPTPVIVKTLNRSLKLFTLEGIGHGVAEVQTPVEHGPLTTTREERSQPPVIGDHRRPHRGLDRPVGVARRVALLNVRVEVLRQGLQLLYQLANFHAFLLIKCQAIPASSAEHEVAGAAHGYRHSRVPSPPGEAGLIGERPAAVRSCTRWVLREAREPGEEGCG